MKAIFGSRFLVLAVLCGCAVASSTFADGWHNAALATGSLDEWLQDIKSVVPDLDNRLSNSSLRSGTSLEELKERRQSANAADSATKPVAGGKIQSNLTAQQQAVLARKANDCMEVLAYMKRENIFPHEFPDFPLHRMTEYRNTAKQLLQMMGPAGAAAVVNQCRSLLMGAGSVASDVTFHPDYEKDILSQLETAASAGHLSPADLDALQEATQGQKPLPLRAFADKVSSVVEKSVDLVTLFRWAQATTDAKRKRVILAHVKARIAAAKPNELEQILTNPDVDKEIRSLAAAEIRKHLTELSVGALLGVLANSNDQDLVSAAGVEISKRNPKFADVQGELDAIWELTKSPRPKVSELAQWNIENAFQRAPVSQCLEWLGKGNIALNREIWKQLDERIARADAARKASYGEVAITTLKSSEAAVPVRIVAAELAGKLKDRNLVRDIVDALPSMPRELWPPVGKALSDITGQQFGPRTGDGIANVNVAVKKWQQWLDQTK